MSPRTGTKESFDLENEAVWLALRTSDGVTRSAHAARFGADPLEGRQEAITACVRAVGSS